MTDELWWGFVPLLWSGPAGLIQLVLLGIAAGQARSHPVPGRLAAGALALLTLQLLLWTGFWSAFNVFELHTYTWLSTIAVVGRRVGQTTAVLLLVAAAVWPNPPQEPA